uniref:Reverse transcriptase domain-containing protein n=1 Tax=Tanacetum cinerariifolium TaxID=118510 RepID=A0A6L2KAU7_TANCI|nr:reverse transcriptase domain-containing protein [Tanacetum cinerariifolium]
MSLTRRIIEFAGPEYKMPTNIKLYDGTTDPEDHLSRFASAANSEEWFIPIWCRMFQQALDRKVDDGNGFHHGRTGGHEDLVVYGLGQITQTSEAFLELETQLRLPSPRPKLNYVREGNTDRIRKVKPFGEGREATKKTSSWQRCSPTAEGIKARLKETRTDLAGFAWEISKPLEKIELEMLWAIPSTIHFMMKLPTLKGVATLVTRTIIIFECMRLEKKKMVEGSLEGEKEVIIIEEVLVNPSFLDQRIQTLLGCLQGLSSNPNGEGRGRENNVLHRPRDILLHKDALQTQEHEGHIPKSPWTLKEMQSLSEKLATLNHFLAKSAERSLPFFNTLKNITKENKHEYRWTSKVEEAFQQMKKLSLPRLIENSIRHGIPFDL